jgi:peptidoglycan/xylan/chitin deacetylase (PgdA/CDA1 family)
MRTIAITIVAAGLLAVSSISAALAAEDCSGNPNALGTARVLTVSPADYARIGAMDHGAELPLADKEVVLTFDDGPLPRYTNQILDILAAQCVKATFFMVGEMARAYPATVHRVFAEGHSIGTHSEDHPKGFGKLPRQLVEYEIDRGIIDVTAALGDSGQVAPFFRVPGLAHSDAIEDELAARHLIWFGSDTVADDWHHRISPKKIIALALSRLEARGKGILLLHDVHRATAVALPALLKELKDRGFHIVQVVPPAAVTF